MIIVKIIGGIGNQMFQYAFAKALSLYNSEVLLDVSDYRFYDDRQYDLACFRISLPLANREQVAQFLPIAGRLAKIKRLIRDFSGQKFDYIREENTIFDKNLLKKYPNQTYFDGYWQSYRYFENFEENLRHDFIFRNFALAHNQNFIDQIKNSQAVSLHIRRGDYVHKPEVSKIFRVLDLDYYKQAIEIIHNKINTPHFFIFSDDIVWAKENLKIDAQMTFIDTPNPNYEDLRLMSLCQHHILANSTFSWWGAWLNNKPNKIVICPEKWYYENTIYNPDLIPEKWIKI